MGSMQLPSAPACDAGRTQETCARQYANPHGSSTTLTDPAQHANVARAVSATQGLVGLTDSVAFSESRMLAWPEKD